MSIESLKSQARRHEQKEEWQKALDQYGKAIAQLEQEDQPDSGLHNRVGDLFVKVGNYEKAIEHYDHAIGLYREAYLLNNAIAVCKKIVRHVPGRNEVYRTMGQIRAEQGFIPDARVNFLRYAELMQEAEDLDESFRALVEFADLVREDVDIRITVADQMLANDRSEEGLEQLKIAYQILKQTEREDRAFGLETRLLELDPSVDLDQLAAEADDMAAVADDGFEYMKPFGEDDDDDTSAPSEDAGDDVAVDDAGVLGGALVEEPVPMAEAVADAWEEEAGNVQEEDESDVADLPLMDGADGFEDEAEEEEAAELPLMGGADGFEDEAEEEEAAELPLMAGADGFEDEAEEEEAAELPLMAGADDFDEDDGGDAPELPLMDVGAAREGVEDDNGLDHPGAARALEEAKESLAPESEPEPSTQYVDLGSMIFGDEPEEPKTTRFRVQYEEPSGDEAADFQKMLSQFKEKVSENLDSGDVRAHHDLGTAYKEMGLLDEAITEFQSALRASADHLPTYELMGQTFLEMGKNEAAAKSLERALKVRPGVEDEFLGIYYYLARAYEQLGDRESAVEFYDRVFSLDINFADVTERLRVLR